MEVFDSPAAIVLSIAITTAILASVAIRKSPIGIAAQFLDQLFTKRFLMFHLLATSFILVLNKLELYLENNYKITNANFTRDIFQFEGSITALIQNTLQTDWLTYGLTFFYVIVFPAVILASLFIYVYQQNEPITRAYFYTIMMNYAFALPFYLFFPVDEVWVYHKQVEFLIPQVYPHFELEYRALSGINNCVPSLHTSMSVSMALLGMYSGNSAWKWITGFSALVIVFSTNYLGIHWFFDIISGFVLAIVSTSAALSVSRGTQEVFAFTFLERNKD